MHMPKLTFRGAFIRFVDLRYDEKSKTVYTKINFTASWTEPIREAMGWGQPSEGFNDGGLEGELVATHFEVIPNGDLKQHAFDLEAKEIHSFTHALVKDGDSATRELRFQITTTALKAAQKLAAFLAVIGKGQAQLKVTYEAQSELEEEAADAQEPLISPEQAHDTSEATDGPTLLSTGRRGARQKPN